MAVRSGSLVAAADVLSITPAAVGQRIKALEDYLGVELLLRSRTGIRASPALAQALPHLERAFIELGQAAEALDMQRAHEIHVSGPSDLLELWLAPRLPAFRKLYPQVRFCLNGEGDAPMRLGPADCRIQFGPVDGGGVDLLFRDFVLPLGTPANEGRTADLPSPSRLEGFPLLHVDFYKDDPAGISWQQWIGRHGLTRTAPERGIRFQRIRAALDSVLADAGFALCGLAMLRPQIEAEQIAFPYPRSMGLWTTWGFTALFRSDISRRAPVRMFRDWLSLEAEQTQAWLQNLTGSEPGA